MLQVGIFVLYFVWNFNEFIEKDFNKFIYNFSVEKNVLGICSGIPKNKEYFFMDKNPWGLN